MKTSHAPKRLLKRSSRLRRNVVVTLEYRCRPNCPNDEPEHGWLEGFWTGEVDHWGKLVFRLVDCGSVPVSRNHMPGYPVYLFPDEILAIEVS